jgi:quercetin dioxygenase-like cupin family protein
MHQWANIEREQLAPGIARRYMYGDNIMVAQILLDKGAVVPKHAHMNEQISNVISGRLEFRFGEDGSDIRVAGPGETVVIPGHLPHEVAALEDAVAVDLFSPPRQDWIDGTDDYFKK